MQQSKDTEWERIMNLPDAEYLQRAVLPVLYQGLRVIDMERPVAPLEMLSMYLLKHQDQIKLPPKLHSSKD